MPARRELHHRQNQLFPQLGAERSQFNDSMPEILKNGSVSTPISQRPSALLGVMGPYLPQPVFIPRFPGGRSGALCSDFGFTASDRGTVFKNKEVMLSIHLARRMMVRTRSTAYMDTEEKTSPGGYISPGAGIHREEPREDNWFLQIETLIPSEPSSRYSLKEDKGFIPIPSGRWQRNDSPPGAAGGKMRIRFVVR